MNHLFARAHRHTSLLLLILVNSHCIAAPHVFTVNDGQWLPAAFFRAQSENHALWLARDHAVLELQTESGPQTVTIRPLGTANRSRPTGEARLAGYSNFFVNSDRDRWRKRVAHYSRVRYSEIYPGIDLVYHANQDALEYDFIVAPDVDPGIIALAFEGAELRVSAGGNLELLVGDQIATQRAPVAYQYIDGERVEVEAAWQGRDDGSFGFSIGSYDRERTLTIDPIIDYASYLGGNGADRAALAGGVIDNGSGHLFIVGSTDSTNFPTTPSAQQTTLAGQNDVFVTKINLTNNAIVWSTYLGGSGDDIEVKADIDAAGNVAVGFNTDSTDLPLAAATEPNPRPMALAKISNDGSSLVFSTYFGGTPGTGTDFENDLTRLSIDSASRIVIFGNTDDTLTPTGVAPVQARTCVENQTGSAADAFLARFSPAGALEFAYCLGGTGITAGRGLAVDDTTGAIFVSGYTEATDFPLVTPIQATLNGARDAYVMKIAPAGDTILWSTFYGGGSLEFPQGLTTDSVGNAIAVGYTWSNDFPTVNAQQPAFAGGTSDGFVVKFAADGSSVLLATYFGSDDDGLSGSQVEGFWSVGVDAADNIYAAGQSDGRTFPLANPVQNELAGPNPGGFAYRNADTVLTKFTSAGALVYSTYLGTPEPDGIRPSLFVTPAGDAYLVGGFFDGLPLVNPIQKTNGNLDAYFARVSDGTQTDTDGIADEIEDTAPNNGDGNDDGILDSQQANVASFYGFNENALTLEAPAGQAIVDLTVQTPPPGAPPDQDFSLGMIRFELVGLAPGGTTTLTLISHDKPPPLSYWKYGPEAGNPTPHWYEFLFDGTTGAQISGDFVTLTLVDGLRGDSDLAANGMIDDPGTPTVPVPDSDGDGALDNVDNCLDTPNPSQCDSDADGYGNHCDTDLDNSGGISNFADLSALVTQFGLPSVAPTFNVADLDCSGGVVNFADLAAFADRFGLTPGPSANQ